MISPSEQGSSENVFRNCKNQRGLLGTQSSQAIPFVPLGKGMRLSLAEYAKYKTLSEARQRIARAPKGLQTEKGSLSPKDLDGKEPSQWLEEYCVELDSITDAFYIFYKLLGLVVREGKYAEAPWRAQSIDEFLGMYVHAEDGTPAPRKARMYIQAADTYLEMALKDVEPPSRISYLVELAKLKPEDRGPVLQKAMTDAKGPRIGGVLRKWVADRLAVRAKRVTAKDSRSSSATPAGGEPNPANVWKACEAETRGLDQEGKIAFFERLIATFQARVRDGLDPFRPVPKCLTKGNAGAGGDGKTGLD